MSFCNFAPPAIGLPQVQLWNGSLYEQEVVALLFWIRKRKEAEVHAAAAKLMFVEPTNTTMVVWHGEKPMDLAFYLEGRWFRNLVSHADVIELKQSGQHGTQLLYKSKSPSALHAPRRGSHVGLLQHLAWLLEHFVISICVCHSVEQFRCGHPVAHDACERCCHHQHQICT